MTDNQTVTLRTLTTVLAADVVGYSRLMGIDDEATYAALKSLRQIALGPLLEVRKGRLANTAGDSLLIEFPSAVEAMRYAIELQNNIAAVGLSVQAEPFRLRIGINLGDVMIDGEDLLGDGVNVAARLEGLAPAGGICISRAVRDQVRDVVDVPLDDLGEVSVKNVARPIRAFRVSGLGDEQPIPARPVAKRRRWAIIATFAALVLIAAGVLWSFLSPPILPSDRTSNRIAVIGFVDGTEDQDQGYLAFGVAEDIATSLSQVEGLEVSPPQPGQPDDPAQAASARGARYVLIGSIRRGDGVLRVTARLLSSTDGAQLWAERWDRPDQDLFVIQDEIAQKVTDALRKTLGALGSTPAPRYAPRIEAYDAYAAGRAKRIPPTPENLAAALALSEQATALDPRFAGGPAGASVVHSLYAYLATSPMSYEAHLAEALRLAERAVTLDPDFGPGHGALAEALIRLGRHEEAIAAVDRAIELAPADALMRATKGRFLAWAGEPQAAIEDIRTSIRMAPDSLPPLYFLGLAQRAAGELEAAIETLEEHRKRLGGRFTIAPNLHLLAAYAQAGRIADAAVLSAEIGRIEPNADTAFADRTNPWRRPADREAFLNALAKAGLPGY